jgi:hypothetical protein
MTPGREALRRRIETALRFALPPVIAFALPMLLMMSAAKDVKIDFFDSNAWNKWDAGHYLSIATKGYDFHPCGPDWCGNAGWMPGYPWMIAGLIKISGMTAPNAAVGISTFFQFATLVLLWIGFLEAKITPQNLLTLAFASVFPGVVYQHAIFPIAPFTFFVMLSLFFASKERWIFAGLAGAVAAFTYSTGFVLALVYGLWTLGHAALAITQSEQGWKAALRAQWRSFAFRFAATCLLTAVGFGLMMLVFQHDVGAWNAPFKVQQKYGVMSNPLVVYIDKIRPAFSSPGEGAVVGFQTLVISLMAIGFAASAERKRWWTDPRDSLLLLYYLGLWATPLTVAFIAAHRAEAYLLPAVLLTRRFPIVIQVTLLILAVLFVQPVAHLYLKGILA